MLLSLLALLILLVLIAIGVTLIIRALLEPAPGSNTSCAACGRDAADLTDFTCPGCGRDVREAGLTTMPLDSAAARFWRAAAVTCFAVAGFGFSHAALWRAAPAMTIYDANATLQPSFKSEIESVEMKFDALSHGRGQAIERGRLVADLAVVDGRMSTLEVDFPRAAARITDENGRTSGEEQLSEAVVRRWLATSGVDVHARQNDLAAGELHGRIDHIGQRWRGFSYRDYDWTGRRTHFIGGWGGSSHQRPARWVAPVLSIAWAILLLLALRRWLRRRSRNAADTGGSPAPQQQQRAAVPA